MDNIQEYEVIMLQEMLPFANRQALEQTRLLMWSSLTPYLKNKSTTAKDLLPLLTDEDVNTELNEDELNDARSRISQVFKQKDS